MNIVYGRFEILHSAPFGILIIRTYGLSPKQISHTSGKSIPTATPDGPAAAFARERECRIDATFDATFMPPVDWW